MLAVLITGVEIVGLIRAMQIPPDVAALISLNLSLEKVAAGLWALLFTIITVNLLRGRAARTAALAFGSFLSYCLVRLLVFTRADYDHNRLPFLVAVSLCLLVFPAVALRR